MIDAASCFEQHRGLVHSLSYRMLGVAADADEVVQEAFLRLLERPPADRDAPLRPWLVRVAMNLCRDRLRQRRRRGWPGPWLPTPVDVIDEGEPGPEGRTSLSESATLAWLLAAEALRPTQRAVLLLRDVYGLSARDTAEALGMSEGNVKVTLHRARRALAAAHPRAAPWSDDLRGAAELALVRFFAALAAGDLAGLQAVLAEDVLALSDGGGEVTASKVPLRGRERVARVYLALAARAVEGYRGALRQVNGFPAVVSEDPQGGQRVVTAVELDAEGRIVRLLSILAPSKLGAVAGLAPA